MTTVTFDKNIKLSSTKFKDFKPFTDDFIKNNYPESNIDNEYLVAGNMKNVELPDTFIKNFVKSYD